jgi:hypothetical protein
MRSAACGRVLAAPGGTLTRKNLGPRTVGAGRFIGLDFVLLVLWLEEVTI